MAVKTILELCAGSGEWSRPYEEAGYKVIRVTLPDGDVRDFIPPPDVHGILAGPPSDTIHMERFAHMSRQERRAITPAGFARAFFEANP